MHIKRKHTDPLYYRGYIGSSEVSCIQVDPGSVYAPQSHATSGNLHLPIECNPNYYLRLQRQWYKTDGNDQAQMPDRGLEIRGDVLCNRCKHIIQPVISH